MGRLILTIVGFILGLLFFIAGFNPYDTSGREFNIIVGITLLVICSVYLFRRAKQAAGADTRANNTHTTPTVQSPQQELPKQQSRLTGSLFVPQALPKRHPNQRDER